MSVGSEALTEAVTWIIKYVDKSVFPTNNVGEN